MKPVETIPVKPYRTIPIKECGEALVEIPRDLFAFFDPHPYAEAGAAFGGISPWTLRKGVLDALIRAQASLSRQKPGWKIKLHNTIRPNAVQAFMVEKEYALQAAAAGFDYVRLTPEQREALAPKVFRIWGIPSENPANPPIHSTGGALDCTLVDERGQEVDMGGPVDDNSERSNPDYYAETTNEIGKRIHANRMLLRDILVAEGFQPHEIEWWHFSRGDQYWAWRERETGRNPQAVALYGRADLV